MSADRDRRWRLVLGPAADEELGEPEGDDRGLDGVLSPLYDRSGQSGGGGLGSSAASVSRWLGDIRNYFPQPVVELLQKDALQRMGLAKLLAEPELLASLEPNVDLVATLLGLAKVIPKKTRETAREVVRKVARRLEERLGPRLHEAVRGSLRSERTSRPRTADIDWDRTIRKNLKDAVVIGGRVVPIPARLVGWKHQQPGLKDVILCIDQSGSMVRSLVYASIFGAVMARIRALTTRFIVFDTAVVDLSDHLSDPVDLLFGAQLGGGTDIAQALAYCRKLVRRPADTVLILISDLMEGAPPDQLLHEAHQLAASGVRFIVLLALSDEGAPAYDHAVASELAGMGIPCFGASPDRFPELMAEALSGRDLTTLAARLGVAAAR